MNDVQKIADTFNIYDFALTAEEYLQDTANENGKEPTKFATTMVNMLVAEVNTWAASEVNEWVIKVCQTHTGLLTKNILGAVDNLIDAKVKAMGDSFVMQWATKPNNADWLEMAEDMHEGDTGVTVAALARTARAHCFMMDANLAEELVYMAFEAYIHLEEN